MCIRDSGYTENQLDNRALYVFDSIALSPQWDLNLGLRYDLSLIHI